MDLGEDDSGHFSSTDLFSCFYFLELGFFSQNVLRLPAKFNDVSFAFLDLFRAAGSFFVLSLKKRIFWTESHFLLETPFFDGELWFKFKMVGSAFEVCA